MRDTRGLVMWGLVIVLAVVLLYNQHSGNQARIRDANNSVTETCRAVNLERGALREYIGQQIDRAEKSLPTLNYYQHHPVELGRALSNLANQRRETNRAFKPLDC